MHVRLGDHGGQMLCARCEIIGVKCLSQEHNDVLPGSGTKHKVDNFAIANLRFYPLSCIAASWDESVKGTSQRHNNAICPK